MRSVMVAVALVAGSAPAAELRVLATSGTQVQGLGIANIEEPVRAGDAVVFRGANTTLAIAGRTFAVMAPAGERSPTRTRSTASPSSGGDVVFAASIAGTAARHALLVVQR